MEVGQSIVNLGNRCGRVSFTLRHPSFTVNNLILAMNRGMCAFKSCIERCGVQENNGRIQKLNYFRIVQPLA